MGLWDKQYLLAHSLFGDLPSPIGDRRGSSLRAGEGLIILEPLILDYSNMVRLSYQPEPLVLYYHCVLVYLST